MIGQGRTFHNGQAAFHCPCHACAFLCSREEEYDPLLPFAKDRETAGERLFQIIDRRDLAHRRSRLTEGDRDVQECEAREHPEIRPWEEAYLRGNRFDQNAMLDLIQDVPKEGRAKGFPMTRLWASMEWALDDLPGVHGIVEYETRLNTILPEYDDVVVCTYGLNRFSAPVARGIMRTHPQMIVGGVLQLNPFSVPQDEFPLESNERVAIAS